MHDDLPCFDDAGIRRGKPSVHKAFGENIALLTGDALIVKAFETLASAFQSDPASLGKAVGILAGLFAALWLTALPVSAQGIDTRAEQAILLDVGTNTVLYLFMARGAAGRPVSVCGELAGDPGAALLLLGMGVDSLSMSSASLLRVKWAIRSFTQVQMRALLDEIRTLEDGQAVRALLHRCLEDAGLGGLVRVGR